MGFVRGFLGGLLGATLARTSVLCFAGGVVAGVWAEQTYKLPNIRADFNRRLPIPSPCHDPQPLALQVSFPTRTLTSGVGSCPCPALVSTHTFGSHSHGSFSWAEDALAITGSGRQSSGLRGSIASRRPPQMLWSAPFATACRFRLPPLPVLGPFHLRLAPPCSGPFPPWTCPKTVCD